MSPEPPEEIGEIRVGPPETLAGGVPAVLVALRHVNEEMGLVRGTRLLLQVNQKGGFDCPGCAWPEPKERALAEFCENGAKAVAEEATQKRAGPDFFAARGLAELSEMTDHALGKAGRLTHPLLLREGKESYEPVSWDEALEVVAEELRGLASPDEAVFYTSGRTSNEAAFLYQLFARALGTNNLPDCSNMCHESSGTGLLETVGVGKGTVQLEDFELADAIFVVGQNPGTNHPRMLSSLESAKKRGATIVSVNPLPEAGLLRFKHPQDAVGMLGEGTALSDLHLPVRVNGDVAFFKGVMKEMLAEEARAPGSVLDRAFIDAHTSGFEALAEDLGRERWEDLERGSGLSREQIRAAARIAIESKRTIVCWAMGLTQHKNGVANVQSIVNLLLLRGQIGRPGAGLCPVRGHSNVQGDRTMGIWEKMPDAFMDALGREFGFEPPRRHGLDTVEAIRAMREGRAKVFFGMGGNFLSAAPDTRATAEALSRCRLTVHVSTKPNRSHLVTGRRALILPCLGRTERDVTRAGEQFVSVEDSMGVVHASRGSLEPASRELRSEVAIVCALARRTLGDRVAIPWEAFAEDYDLVRERIARVVPGFERYNERIRRPGGFVLPNAAREREFRTADGKARFTVHPLPKHDLRDGELLLMSIRSHDQYNTTIYGEDDRYRGIRGGRRVVFLNPEDARDRGLRAGDVVDIVSRWKDGERLARRFLVVPYPIARGGAATYYPEANVLVPLDHVADKSNTPASKSVVVSLRKSADA